MKTFTFYEQTILDCINFKSNIMRTQRNFFIALSLILLICFSAQAQEVTAKQQPTTEATAETPKAQYKVVNGEVVKIEKAKDKRAQSVKTELTYTVKSVKYPVYKGSKGGHYILRTSKKSGKQYKQYLPIIEL